MINYRGKPVLGPDSSIKNTSEFFALAGTILFWLLFLIFSFIIRPQPKKQYKEVQIVLSSTPVVQKSEESPAPAEQAAASAASSEPVVQEVVETPPPAPKAEPVKKTETPATKAQTKPAAKTTSAKPQPQPKPAPTPSEPQKLAKSVDDAIAEMNRSSSKGAISDEDFDKMMNNADSKTSGEQSSSVVTTQNSMGGNVGTVTNNTDGPVKSSKTSNQKTDNSSHQTDINKVRNAKGNETGINETGAGKSISPTNGNNKDSITWADGTGKRSVYSFDAELSEKAKSSMYVSKATPFNISFSVDPDGNVLISSITISNEFILTDIIKEEMKAKISKWKFGKGTGISKATFTWILAP